MDTRDRIIEFKILWGISNIARSNIDGHIHSDITKREREREVHYMTSVPILRLDIGLHHFFHLFVIFSSLLVQDTKERNKKRVVIIIIVYSSALKVKYLTHRYVV